MVVNHKDKPAQFISWIASERPKDSAVLKILHQLCRILYITGRGFKDNDLSLRAGALTYGIMLSLVPLIAMSTAVVKGMGGGDQLKQAVYRYVETLETTSGSSPQLSTEVSASGPEEASPVPRHLYEAVDKIFAYVDRTNFATLGTIGIGGVIISIIMVLGNIEAAMNTIWRVNKGRSLLRKIADYIALVVLMPVSVNLGLASGAVLKSDVLLTRFSLILPKLWVQTILLNLLPVFFLSLTLYVLYLFFPNTRVKSIPALIGAIIAGFFWFKVQNLYISLQVGVSKYNAIYGSFATLPLFLVWLYCGWIFILAGAQIAYAVQHRSSYQIKPISITPSLQLAIAFDLIDFFHLSFSQGKESSLSDFLASHPDYPGKESEQTLNLLLSHHLLHKQMDSEAIMPSRPMHDDIQQQVVRIVFGEDYYDTPGGLKSQATVTGALTAQISGPPLSEADRRDRPGKKEGEVQTN